MKENLIKELLLEARCSYLKKYNKIKIDELVKKSKEIFNELENIQNLATNTEIDEETSKNYIYLKSTYDFYQKVIRAYNFSRFLKIQEIILKNEKIPDCLNKEENEHVIFFNDIFNEYKENFPDLNFENNHIPIHHFVHFLTLQDCGIVMDGDIMYELKANRYFYLKKSIIAHLIDTEMIRLL